MPTTNGKEQVFNFGIKNNDDRPADTTVDFLATVNLDGTQGKISTDDIPLPKPILDFSNDFDPLLSQNQTTLEFKLINLQPISTRLTIANTAIYSWGDSLTAGSGGSGTTYPIALAGLTVFTVTNKGVPGETSTQIKDRLVAEPANYSKSVIIWAGRNNYTDPATVKADIATMIATLGHDRYLVCSVLNGDYGGEYKNAAGWTTITTLNNDLKALYGSRYVELRDYLVSLHTNSAQDLIDFGRDIPPTSLRSDAIHLNAAGYTKVAEYLNQRLGILFGSNGYFQDKDFAYYFGLYNAGSSILNQITVDQVANFRLSGLGIATTFISRNGTAADFSKIHYRFQNGASNRIGLGTFGSESTANAGSNFFLSTFTDAGALLANPFVIFRNTGNTILGGGTSVPTDTGYKLYVNGSLLSTSLNIASTPTTATVKTQMVSRNPSNGNIEVSDLSTNSILNQTTAVQTAGFRIDGIGNLRRYVTTDGTANDFSKAHHGFQTGAVNRVSFNLVNNESGSDTGSDFALVMYDDAGVAKSNPFTAFRNGNMVFKGTNALAVDAGYRMDVFGNIRTDGTFTFTTPPTTSAGTYDILTFNPTTKIVEKVSSSNLTTSGTYTPVCSNNSNFGSGLVNRDAVWTRTGNIVNVKFDFVANVTTASTDSNIDISLPFPVATGDQQYIGGGSGSVSPFVNCYIQANSGASVCTLFAYPTTATSTRYVANITYVCAP